MPRRLESIAALRETFTRPDRRSTMLKQTTTNFHPRQLGEAALAASRQVWLASLGAAVVTRDWVQTEAGNDVQDAGQGRHRRRIARRSASSATRSRARSTRANRCGGAPAAPSSRRSSRPPTPRSTIVQTTRCRSRCRRSSCRGAGASAAARGEEARDARSRARRQGACRQAPRRRSTRKAQARGRAARGAVSSR